MKSREQKKWNGKGEMQQKRQNLYIDLIGSENADESRKIIS